MSKKYKNSFKRPKPSIPPKKVGLDLLDESLTTPLKSFHINIKKIREIINSEADENMLRYAIVLVSGALDKYMHDIQKAMILQIFKGNAPPGKNFDDFLIPIELLYKFDRSSFDIDEKEKILNDALYEIISGFTMQKSYSIERNMNYIINFNIWKAILPRIMMRFKELNSITQLKLFVDDLADRRNVIAHELDYMPNSSTKFDITHDFVLKKIDVIQYFIESINYQIETSVSDYDPNSQETAGETNE